MPAQEAASKTTRTIRANEGNEGNEGDEGNKGTKASNGGIARAKKVSQERLSEIGRLGAVARWGTVAVFGGGPAKSRKAKKTTGELMGAIDEGRLPVARFNVGLKLDMPQSGSIAGKKGSTIPQDKAITEFYKLRSKQVGERAADATILRCEGRFEGAVQKSLSCEVAFLPTPDEKSEVAFRKNMVDLAENLCGRLGQEEVWLWFGPRLIRASAPGQKAPKTKTGTGKVIR